MLLLVIFAIVLQLILNRNQSKRINALEQSIYQLKTLSSQTKSPPLPEKILPQPVSSSNLTAAPNTQSAAFAEKTPPEKPAATRSMPSLAHFMRKAHASALIAVIKDNWIGGVGALAIVFGGVFFSLTAEIMKNPFARIGLLLLLSLSLVFASFTLKKHTKWVSLSSWLTSIAGAITLFVSFGAGAIDGLLCIHNPMGALVLLCAGIGANLVLALRSASQLIASFHVLLSIAALCMIPQTPQLLFIGAIVSAAGLIACFRYKWELHLSLIITTFSMQNTLCWLATESSSPLLPIMSSLLVGCSAAMVHYKKSYQRPPFAILPFAIHLLNWGLLGWNVFLYSTLNPWTPIALGGAAIAGFTLAQLAKRNKIAWLFHTDTMLAQLMAIAALISLAQFQIKPIDLAILLSIELFLFNSVCNLQKEKILVRYGYALQWALSFVIIALLLRKDMQHDVFFYARIGVITLINWGYYFMACLKKFLKDGFICFISKDKNLELAVCFRRQNSSPSFLQVAVSPLLLTGSIFLCIGAFYSDHSLFAPFLIALFVFGLALWKKWSDLPELDFTLLCSLFSLHLIYWHLLVAMPSPSIGTIVSIGALDLAVIFGKFLHSRALKNVLYCIAIYGLAVHCILVTDRFIFGINPLIPGIIYLGLSLGFLEISKLRYLKIVSHFFFQVGFLSLLCFLADFLLIHLQVFPVWNGVFIRWIIEALGLLTVAYWFFFPPKNIAASRVSTCLHQGCFEILVGFLTLCIFTECAEHWRALSWAMLAYALLKTPRFPRRIYLYSWGYFLASIVHTAFLSHYQVVTASFTMKSYLPVFISLIAQTFYVIASFTQNRRESIAGSFYRLIFVSPCLSTVLPLFSGIALTLFFNFEKALLTLLWVGLVCLYTIIALAAKSKRAMQISLGALAICSIRLLVFDLTQQSLSIRALVFFGAGVIMLLISVLYNKFKHRLDISETI